MIASAPRRPTPPKGEPPPGPRRPPSDPARLVARWGEAAVVADGRGEVVAVNRAYVRLTGWRREDLARAAPGAPGLPPPAPARGRRRLVRARRPDGEGWWALEEVVPIAGGQAGVWTWVRDALAPSPAAVPDLDGLEVTPVFQPVISLADGRTIAYEALSRLRLGEEALMPDAFFAALEAAGPAALGAGDRRCLTALGRSLGRLPAWPEGVRLSVNVRRPTLARPAWFRRWLTRLPLAPEQVVIELSEADFACGLPEDWADLRRRYPDVAFAVDDWGAGWHDIGRLTGLRPEWVKVDRTWLWAARESAVAGRLLGHLAAWGRECGVTVVAEGVETAEEEALVRSLGLTAAQGYRWGRPTAVPSPPAG